MIIVIEGGDQAGKFTQATLLYKALTKNKISAKLFHFPDYKTPIGKKIKQYLDGKQAFPPQAIHCLLSANRWERLSDILAAKKDNSILIMNRYYHSNLVYGKANGLAQKWLENLDDGLPKPDLVILLDVTQKDSFHRQKIRRDKFEKNIEFSKKISRIYKTIAKKNHWSIIDASQSKEEVHYEILNVLSRKLGL